MKLLTPALHTRLRANHDLRLLAFESGLAEPDHFPVVRFFNPVGPATWLATEIDEHDVLFGLADLGFGCPELGSFALRELQEIRLPFGLGIERDLAFAARHPLSVYAESARRTGSLVAGEQLLARSGGTGPRP